MKHQLKKSDNPAPGYGALAACYDRLNSDIDYGRWADFICSFIGGGGDGKRVIDLACGTGAMTAALARRGFIMTGADVSPDMLAEAKRRSDKEKLDILYIRQDIRYLELAASYDAAVCCLDGINHLTDAASLDACFSGVARFLKPGSFFIFDLNAPYKFENIYADRDYILEDEGLLCAWRNYYNKKNGLCRFELSIFTVLPDGSYRREDEIQIERRWTMGAIKKALIKNGFSLEGVWSDFDRAPVKEDGERWFFAAKKQ